VISPAIKRPESIHRKAYARPRRNRPKIKQWYKDDRRVEKCMQPVVDANVKRKIEARYQEKNKELGEEDKLTKKEKAMVKDQTEAEKEMTDRVSKMSQAQQDRMVVHQFKCMADVCGFVNYGTTLESEEQRNKRTAIQYQECMQKKMMDEYAKAVDEIMGDVFIPQRGAEVNKIKVEKKEPAEKKADTPVKSKQTKVVVEKVETKVTSEAEIKGHSDKPAKKEKEDKEPEKKAEKNNVKPEKKAEPVKTAEPEKKAKKEKKDTDTWFDRTVLGVKLPKMPWNLAAVEAKKTQFLQVSKGVERTVLKAGDGINFPKNGDTVTMHYTGTLTDGGKKFDSSVDRGQPFVTQIGVGQVIKGWDEGVVKMSLGEKAVLKMTSDYGYGAEGAGADIPPNAGLTFEVELLKIN